MTRGLFLCEDPRMLRRVWGPEQRARLARIASVPDRVVAARDLLEGVPEAEEAEVLFSTWGMPRLGPEHLAALPRLRAVFYAGGTVKEFSAPLFDREIAVVSAWAANALPVAEYVLSQVLFGMKLGWAHVRQQRGDPSPGGWRRLAVPGAYGGTVGLVSLGMVGRRVAELLRPFSLEKLAYDPFIPAAAMEAIGARPAALEEIFARSDVISLHTAELPETEGMIGGELLGSMKPHATLVNTARGSVVDEEALCAVLARRPDLTAVLDVCRDEPPRAGSPLYHLPNVVLTPHIAGSLGNEVRRMADWMIEEFDAWRSGRPLRYAVEPSRLGTLA